MLFVFALVLLISAIVAIGYALSYKQQLNIVSEQKNRAESHLSVWREEAENTKHQLTDVQNELTDFQDFYKIDHANEASFNAILEERRAAHKVTLDSEAAKVSEKLDETKKMLAVQQGKLTARAQEEKQKINDEIQSIRNEIGVWESKLNESMEHYNAAIQQERNAIAEISTLQQKCLPLTEDQCADIAEIYEFIDKLHNKELLCKFIWSEYIRGPLDTLLRKQDIGEVAGIYKITNIFTKEAYIGRSVNIRKRIQDHFKSAVGIESIADQEVHHAIRDVGFQHFMVEKLCECTKDELNEKEKYYIDLFNTRNYGYNKNTGG